MRKRDLPNATRARTATTPGAQRFIHRPENIRARPPHRLAGGLARPDSGARGPTKKGAPARPGRPILVSAPAFVGWLRRPAATAPAGRRGGTLSGVGDAAR